MPRYPLVCRNASCHSMRVKRLNIIPAWTMPFLFLSFLPLAQALEDQTAQFVTSLFTDFAPILSLFGLEASKQYLSQSIGWIDDILFAMAPLGVLTIMVGAIRVAGYDWMRNLIGKAREPSGVSEAEYLSSTSEDVFEVWDKKGVVRKVGNEKIRQILYDSSPGAQDVMSMWNAEFPNLSENLNQIPYITRRDKFKKEFSAPEDPEARRNWDNLPPNLTLNAYDPIDSRYELGIFTFVAVLIQLSVIIFQALTAYRLNWRNPSIGHLYETVAFPLACSGLVTMCTGVFICAWVIESSTQEIMWIEGERTKAEKKRLQVMWVQQSSPEGLCQSYVIYRDDPTKPPPTEFRPIWGSYRVDDPRIKRSMNIWVFFGTLFCTLGFLAQVTGLRGLHFSATLAQFLATLAVTAIRSFVRRGLATPPFRDELPKGYELDQVSLMIAGLKSCYPAPRYLYWKDIDDHKQFFPREENPIVEIRSKLAEMTKWQTPHFDLVNSLCRLVVETLNLVDEILRSRMNGGHKRGENRAIELSCIDIPVDINARHAICERARTSPEFMQRVVLKFRKDGEQWACDPYAIYHLEALISLWIYSFIFRQQRDEIKYNDTFPTFGTYISWKSPVNKVLSDFLTIIGHAKDKKILTELLDMGKVSNQNIVEIVSKHAKLKTKEIPRNYIPIYLDVYENQTMVEHEETREPVFIPLEHLFGEEYDDYYNRAHGHDLVPDSALAHSEPLYAYKYIASPAHTSEAQESESANREWREQVKPIVAQIFAQRIYRNFVYTLRDMCDGPNGSEVGLSRKEVKWLNRSFVRSHLGSREQGLLCMFPLWDPKRDKEESGTVVETDVIILENYS